MKKTDAWIALLRAEIENKTVLEAACGAAECSVSAAAYAADVFCIDLDDSRLRRPLPSNVHFEKMDAADMAFPDEMFDMVMLYNALFHIRSQWTEIERECKRVLKAGGSLFLVATWKLDVRLLLEMFGERVKRQGPFWTVRIEK